MVSTVSRSDAPVSTFASFVVEDGQPGRLKYARGPARRSSHMGNQRATKY